jgi:hypothetical protein
MAGISEDNIDVDESNDNIQNSFICDDDNVLLLMEMKDFCDNLKSLIPGEASFEGKLQFFITHTKRMCKNLLFTGGGKNLLEVYMNMAHLLHFGSRALRNFDDDKQGSGAKVRIQILKQLIMDKAKTQRLNQRNKKAREKHLNGNKPMMLVPGKGGKLYYCWTKKDCDFEGLKKQLIKQELKMLLEAELKINKSDASHVDKLSDKQKIKKVHNNWGYMPSRSHQSGFTRTA